MIEEMLTMVRNKDLVYAHDGKLYKYDEHWSNYTTYIPISEVISVDGVNRMVTTANRTIPGPSIIVYEDQQVIVHVQNKLLSDSTSIHWHGLHQKGTPWMDGVAYISQCPIAAGQTFTYKFQVKESSIIFVESSQWFLSSLLLSVAFISSSQWPFLYYRLIITVDELRAPDLLSVAQFVWYENRQQTNYAS